MTRLQTLLAVLLALAVTAPAAGSAVPQAAGPRLVFDAFSGHPGAGATPPVDRVAPGGSYGSCRYFQRLYAFSRFRGMTNGRPTSVVWLLDGHRVYSDAWRWDGGRQGRMYFYIEKSASSVALPDGRYEVQLRYAGKLLARASVGYAVKYC